MNLIESIKDWYLTRKTGKDRRTREWEDWYHQTVNYRASTIRDMFKNFEYVFTVDSQKFFDFNEPFSWIPNAEASEYFWPKREINSTCVWRFERVFWDRWTESWHINELAGEDMVFIATNNSEDATMLTLRFS